MKTTAWVAKIMAGSK